MAKRRADYSRMVSLDLSPTEAAIIGGVLGACAQLAENVIEREMLEGAAERIKLQLKAIAWPADPARKAPYPV